MITRSSRTIRTVVGTAVAAFALTACGSADTDPAPAKPTVPRAQLLPGAADFPSGTEYQPMNSAAIAGTFTESYAPLLTGSVTPPQCDRAAKANATSEIAVAEAADAATAMDAATGSFYIVEISDGPFDLHTYVGNRSGACAEVTGPMGVGGQVVSSHIRVTPETVPGQLTDAKAAMYSEETRDTATDGTTSTTRRLVGIAVVRGYTLFVVVQGENVAPQRSTFEALFTKSVTKVEEAK
ncbi:hypothetical protein [Nocardia sp. XZ_19_369]|uniref:hypothetical protein n=1 Tax=Nocardia sp. XZ_19_369 TaxID=2769487 RepID=UPI00188F267E|nr:hypothetical protein [Nocardia sp. XZ_19_369]